jgi:PPOX class probable F420-dependent enzyme
MSAELDGGAAAFVAEQRCVHVDTVDAGGRPHVVPVSPVLDDGVIWFATEAATKKVRNIRQNPAVSLCFDSYSEDWQALKLVVVHGDAQVVGPGPMFSHVRDLLYAKYRQYATEAPVGEEDSVMIAVRPARVVTESF